MAMVKLTYVDVDGDCPEVIKVGVPLKDGEGIDVPEEEAERYKLNRWWTVGAPVAAKAGAHHEPEPAKPALRK